MTPLTFPSRNPFSILIEKNIVESSLPVGWCNWCGGQWHFWELKLRGWYIWFKKAVDQHNAGQCTDLVRLLHWPINHAGRSHSHDFKVALHQSWVMPNTHILHCSCNSANHGTLWNLQDIWKFYKLLCAIMHITCETAGYYLQSLLAQLLWANLDSRF